QFFAIDEAENYHYMGPVQFKGKSCVFEDFASYTHILLDVCYKVTGFKHGQHVDLKIDDTFERQHTVIRALDKPATPPAAVEQLQIEPAAAKPCCHSRAELEYDETNGKVVAYKCLSCGERVG
ncbi:unnamed protein product, partial [marine sediment metagenome]